MDYLKVQLWDQLYFLPTMQPTIKIEEFYFITQSTQVDFFLASLEQQKTAKAIKTKFYLHYLFIF